MPLTRGKKILLGCLVALASLIIGMVVAVVLAITWLRAPGPDLDTHRLLDEGTGFYLELRLRRDDPGSRDLFRSFVESQRQPVDINLDQAPPWAAWLFPRLQSLAQQDVTDEEIDKALPAAVLITAQQGEAGGPAPPLFVGHLPMTGKGLRVADWLLGWAMEREGRQIVRRHGEETYFRLPDELPFWVSIVGTDLLLALEEEAVVSGIDRLARPSGGIETAPLVPLLAGVPGEAVLRLAALPGQGAAVLDLLEPLVPEWTPALEAVLAGAGEVRAWGFLESADVLAGEVLVEGGAAPPPAGEAGQETLLTLEHGPVRLQLVQPPAGASRWSYRLEGLEPLVRLAGERLRNSDRISGRTPRD